jgi:FG-GAP repeat
MSRCALEKEGELRTRTLLPLVVIALGTRIPTSSPLVPLAAATHQPSSAGAVCDFNNDALPDRAIGVPSEDVDTLVDAGVVDVLYGSTSGLQSISPQAQEWTQSSPGMPDQAEAGNRFGWSLACADFNGDGFGDLAVGAATETVSGFRNAGAVNVLYGSGAGLQTESPPAQYWSQDSPDVEGNAARENRFGRSVGAADFNGDGYEDLVVGIPFQAVNSHSRAGAVSVLYGSATGLQANGTGGPDDQFWNQDSPDTEDDAQTADRFGWAMTVGDFNADGYSDLAVGVPLESLEFQLLRSTGGVNVLYGSPTGLQATGEGGPNDQFWTQDSEGVEEQAENRDRLGWTLAAGDLNGDGFGDLAMGATFEDLAVLGAGGVNVLYGSATGLQAIGDGGPDDQFWNQDSTDVEDQAEPQDWFAWSLTVGDFNADGFGDLAVGVRVEDVGSILNAGAVSVLYGSATGLQANGTGGPDDQFWTQDSDGVENQSDSEDEFGWNVAAADFNGDGFRDLVVGVPLEDVNGYADAGAVNVFYGSPTGLQATGAGGPEDQFWTQDDLQIDEQAEAGDEFGDALTGASCLHPCHAPFPT